MCYKSAEVTSERQTRSSGLLKLALLVVLVLDNGLRNGDVVVEMLDLPVCLFQKVNVNL